MAVGGWIVDRSVSARANETDIGTLLGELSGFLWTCPVGELEQLYSSRSAVDYDRLAEELGANLLKAPAPPDLLDRALRLQRDLAHHHGLWHRTPIPDLLIAETALHHELGIIHVDRNYERIAEVRALRVRRLR